MIGFTGSILQKKTLFKHCAKGKYYEYQIKRAALDDDYLMGNIDELQYTKESLDLDLKYKKYIQHKK